MDIQEIKDKIADLGSDNLEMFGGKFVGGIRLQQNLDEISNVVAFLMASNKSFKNLLEVGAAAGGNARVFSDFLGIDTIKIIDNNQHSAHVYRKDNLKGKNVEEYIGDSQSKEAQAWALSHNQLFDLVYIDADHSEEGVKRDIQNYKSLVAKDGYMIFHDSVFCSGVSNALEAFEKTGEFTKVFADKTKFGISIYQLTK